jgi:acyl dehydratase
MERDSYRLISKDMAEETVITADMRRSIGAEASPVVIEIERGAVRKFAEAVGDANPLWRDEEYARNTRYGGILAPPSFLCTAGAGFSGRIEIELPLKRLLVVADELEFCQPIRVGEVITCNQRLVDLQEREGKKGKQVFVVYENVFTDQKGEMVARGRATYLRY